MESSVESLSIDDASRLEKICFAIYKEIDSTLIAPNRLMFTFCGLQAAYYTLPVKSSVTYIHLNWAVGFGNDKVSRLKFTWLKNTVVYFREDEFVQDVNDTVKAGAELDPLYSAEITRKMMVKFGFTEHKMKSVSGKPISMLEYREEAVRLVDKLLKE